MNIAIDFDGTITDSNIYPRISGIRENAAEAINSLQKKGHKCFLWTCRQGKELEDAILFLRSQGIEMDGYNQCNYEFGNRKMIAELYIDDRAYPLVPIKWAEIYKNITGEEL